ncbi:hypothetical protein OTSKARP_1553 [Orientia tsutsugamushi str. Karp]|nr:hypothetical protein OTSKARP_1553 [Orientia tsutsugamushi str. Karp]
MIKRYTLVKGKSFHNNLKLREYLHKNVKLISLSACLKSGRFFGVNKKVNVLFVLI